MANIGRLHHYRNINIKDTDIKTVYDFFKAQTNPNDALYIVYFSISE